MLASYVIMIYLLIRPDTDIIKIIIVSVLCLSIITHITPACAGIIFQFFPRRAGKIDNNFECEARGIIMKITPTCFSTRGYFNIT